MASSPGLDRAESGPSEVRRRREVARAEEIAALRCGLAQGRQGSFGELVLRELRAEGLDVRGIVDLAAPTGLMVKERRTARSLGLWHYRAGSAASRLWPEDIGEDVFAHAALLHVTGITPAVYDSAAEVVCHAIELARRHGTTVSFDVNYRSKLWSREAAGKGLLDIVRACDVVFAGPEEASLFVSEEDPHTLASAPSATEQPAIVHDLDD
ncbi:PfkB family carbohydrate kinase [Streptomyces sp. NPDC057460]|uniref:PfkB family carbohydrate kinase n=1 Tax=Streptomyces sp. NPDC057460 TaxID=3346141 RepID=UPI003674A523